MAFAHIIIASISRLTMLFSSTVYSGIFIQLPTFNLSNKASYGHKQTYHDKVQNIDICMCVYAYRCLQKSYFYELFSA